MPSGFQDPTALDHLFPQLLPAPSLLLFPATAKAFSIPPRPLVIPSWSKHHLLFSAGPQWQNHSRGMQRISINTFVWPFKSYPWKSHTIMYKFKYTEWVAELENRETRRGISKARHRGPHVLRAVRDSGLVSPGNQRYVDRGIFLRCFLLFLRDSSCKCINRIQQEMCGALLVGSARAVFKGGYS